MLLRYFVHYVDRECYRVQNTFLPAAPVNRAVWTEEPPASHHLYAISASKDQPQDNVFSASGAQGFLEIYDKMFLACLLSGNKKKAPGDKVNDKMYRNEAQ